MEKPYDTPVQMIDSCGHRMSHCLRAVVGTARPVKKRLMSYLGQDLILTAPQAIEALL